MPELPDVETYRRYINRTALNKKIRKVSMLDSDLLEDVSGSTIRRNLKDTRIKDTDRRGKYLFVELENDYTMIWHFGMTGFVSYFKHTENNPDHTRMRLDFSNGYHLAYSCQRKLGIVSLTKDKDGFIQDRDLGPDWLKAGISLEDMKEAFGSRRGTIKSALMNQNIYSGIGNVYSDEILFKSGIRPDSKTSRLDTKALKKLHRNIKKVLDKTIEHKAQPEKFPRSYLTRIRDKGEDCPICGGNIKKKTISGRSSYFCPEHQKKY